MADGKAAGGKIGEEGLDIAERRLAGRGVAVVADGTVTAEPGEHGRLVEIVADETQIPLGMELAAVERDDAAGFLAPVLERVEAENGQGRRIWMAEDAEDAAFLAKPVVVAVRHAGSP